MTVTLRSFEAGDYSAVMRLWEATEGVGLSDADSPAGISQYLERNPSLSLVAVESNVIIGTILCGHDGRRGLIHHVVVASTHRRRGIGRQLVQRGLASLRQQGMQKCHLLVFGNNAQAQKFWRRMGAEERTSLIVFSLATREDG